MRKMEVLKCRYTKRKTYLTVKVTEVRAQDKNMKVAIEYTQLYWIMGRVPKEQALAELEPNILDDLDLVKRHKDWWWWKDRSPSLRKEPKVSHEAKNEDLVTLKELLAEAEAAEDVYLSALLSAYGSDLAGYYRCNPTKQSPRIQALGDVYRGALNRWQAGLRRQDSEEVAAA